jgi:hypothetical protein
MSRFASPEAPRIRSGAPCVPHPRFHPPPALGVRKKSIFIQKTGLHYILLVIYIYKTGISYFYAIVERDLLA